MRIYRTSELTGRGHVREVAIPPKEYVQGLMAWRAGALIQDAFPTLSQDDREFIKTGITPTEWDEIFSED